MDRWEYVKVNRDEYVLRYYTHVFKNHEQADHILTQNTDMNVFQKHISLSILLLFIAVYGSLAILKTHG